MNKDLNQKFLTIPVIVLVIFFLGNAFTLVKALLLVMTIFIFYRKNFIRLFDINFVFLFIFIFLYFIISLYGGYEKTGFNQQLLACLVLYLAGRWVGFRSPDSRSVVRIFWVVGLGLSSTTLLAVFRNIAEFGFQGDSRNLKVFGGDKEVSATVLAGLLVVLVAYGGVVFSGARTIRLIEKILVLTFFAFAIAAAVRLGSRTILVIGLVSLLQGAFVNMSRRHLWLWFPIVFLFFYFIYIGLDYLGGYIDIFNYYKDRQDNDQAGVGSAGGRTEKWGNAIVLMLQYPFGWGISKNGYSHNLWLDAARNGGIPTFFMALVISVLAIRSFVKTLARSAGDKYYTTAIACAAISYLLLFFVEPIFDGFIYVFASFCCLWGIASAHPTRPPHQIVAIKNFELIKKSRSL